MYVRTFGDTANSSGVYTLIFNDGDTASAPMRRTTRCLKRHNNPMARLFVDNLTVIDFSYLDVERGVVGESWIVDIELAGELNEQGMVFDFGHVKKQIKQYIDAEVDHRLLVPTQVADCHSELLDGVLSVEFPLSSGGRISHKSPKDAVMLVAADAIKRQHIATELESGIKEILPSNVTDVTIHLRTESIDGAYYHYTHGLRKHLGQCQRIAHGHRSRIQISTNGQRNAALETLWAKRLEDSYIATANHIINEFSVNGIAHTHLAYAAQQGDFAISVPSDKIFTMSVESTVENIARHLAKMIAEENNCSVEVKAFEGPDKGAYSEASV